MNSRAGLQELSPKEQFTVYGGDSFTRNAGYTLALAFFAGLLGAPVLLGMAGVTGIWLIMDRPADEY